MTSAGRECLRKLQDEKGISKALRMAYDALAVKASDCTECGACTARCPFGVDVIARMKQAMQLFERNL
jgi:predicted aldo/keto reductase-like oxidoreductase